MYTVWCIIQVPCVWVGQVGGWVEGAVEGDRGTRGGQQVRDRGQMMDRQRHLF